MLSERDSVVRRLGKVLRVQIEDVIHEPLPKRWVDLILHLDELERSQQERNQRDEPQRKSSN